MHGNPNASSGIIMAVESFQVLARHGPLTLEAARDGAARRRLFEFERDCFLRHYQAEISDDSPTLIGAFDAARRVVAAFGLRDAASGFFCEHYLDAPLDEALRRHYGPDVARRQVVEVTHLCASRPGFLRALVPMLPAVLVRDGYRYLTCTATRCLAGYFTRRGIPSVTLGMATSGALPAAERERWGAYYAAEPRVMAGDLNAAGAALGLDLQATGG